MGTEKCIVILETSEIRITCMLCAIPYQFCAILAISAVIITVSSCDHRHL